MSATYSQRLDEWASTSGGSWKAWSEWVYVTPFERQLFWFAEAQTPQGQPLATVTRLRTPDPYNGHATVARRLWRTLTANEPHPT